MTTAAPGDLAERVGHYLRAHHTMTIATVGPPEPAGSVAPTGAVAPIDLLAPAGDAAAPTPHAASVFYAVDDRMRLVFLSKQTSRHGLHIGREAPVAVTVTEQYDDWEQIQGVQLWGSAKRLAGAARAAAMATYIRRFPFVKESMAKPRLAEALRAVGVYRVEAARVAFTDNTTGVFGREVLDLKG